MFKRVLIPLDGSENAEKVLPAVDRILKVEGARAVLVRAVYCPLAGNPHEATILGELEKSAVSYLADTAGRLKRSASDVETRVLHGDPAKSILRTAQEESCDLIAMTTHGHRFLADIVLGSTIEAVRHKAHIPLLIVRAE